MEMQGSYTFSGKKFKDLSSTFKALKSDSLNSRVFKMLTNPGDGSNEKESHLHVCAQ